MVCILPPKAFCTRDSKLPFLLVEALEPSEAIADGEVGVDFVVVDDISGFEALAEELFLELFDIDIGNVDDEVADDDDEVTFAEASCE